MVAYAAREDLYRYGLPRGQLANPGRLCAAVHSDSSSFELDQHGFENGTAVLFRAESGGVLPAPIETGTTYYAIRSSESLFQVSATDGGSALELLSIGASVVVATSLEPVIDAELERYSRLVDSYLPAHQVPLESPYPVFVVGSVAKLAAASLLEITGQASPLIQSSAEQTRRELARMMKGVPLRDGAATAPANLAVAESVSVGGRGWDTTGGTLP